MKKRICMLLLLAMTLSGCTGMEFFGQPAGTSGGEEVSLEFFDNLPDLGQVGVEEYLAYFETGPDFVELEDYVDPRDPYAAATEAKKEAAGKGVKEFYDQQSILTGQLSRVVENTLDTWNDTAPIEDYVLLFFIPLNSMELAMGATLTEQQDWNTVSSGVKMAFLYLTDYEASVTRTAAHNYTVSYTAEGVEVVDHFRADPRLGMQMRSYQDGALTLCFEYLNPREGLHIWQSQRERLVMLMDGKTVVSYAYTQLLEEQPIHGEDALILEADMDKTDQQWLEWALCDTSHSADNQQRFYCWLFCDGKDLYLTTSASLFSEPPHLIIPAG